MTDFLQNTAFSPELHSQRSSGTNLSLILPAYHEYNRPDVFETAIEEYQTFFDKELDGFELVVFADGCDKTAQLAESLGVMVLNHDDGLNHGRGRSVTDALTRKTDGRSTLAGEIAGYTDADGSYPPSTIMRLYEQIADGPYEIAVAHRSENQASSLIRKIAHPIMHSVCERLAPTGVKDPQAGAKLFSRRAIEDVVSQTVTERWAWDREVLAIALRDHIPVADIGSKITPHDQSTVDAARAAVEMFRDSYRIKMTHLS